MLSKRDLLRFTAELPRSLPERARLPLIHTIRHEYGHALFSDYLAIAPTEVNGQGGYLAYFDPESEDPSDYPPALRPVLEECITLPKTTYQAPHFMSDFSEYMAESYARYLGGYDVPPAMSAFLDSLCTR